MAATEEQGHVLIADEHDFFVDTDDQGEQLDASLAFMARLEKVDTFEAKHETDGCSPCYDTYTNDGLINEFCYATDNESIIDQDKLSHDTTTTISLVAEVETSSLALVHDDSQVVANSFDSTLGSIDYDHSLILQNYALIQTQIESYAKLIKAGKDRNACLGKSNEKHGVGRTTC